MKKETPKKKNPDYEKERERLVKLYGVYQDLHDDYELLQMENKILNDELEVALKSLEAYRVLCRSMFEERP